MGKILAMAMMAEFAAIAQAMDWAAINAAARESALAPIRPGVPGESPFWNGFSRAFIHPPAFDFADIPGAAQYRFEVIPDILGISDSLDLSDTSLRDEAPPSAGTSLKSNDEGDVATSIKVTHCFIAAHPWLPVDAAIWDSLAPGYYKLRVTPLDKDGVALAGVVPNERVFYRAAVFRGPYPPAPRPYREAAARVYAAVARLPQVRGWLSSDEPPEGYDLYCYPSKILGSMIRALCRDASASSCSDPIEGSRSLTIARRMADWLLAQSEPEGAPLAHFPPTYWGNRRRVAVENAGRIMLSYPAQAALAYFDLADAIDSAESDTTSTVPRRAVSGAGKYRTAALAIVRTYVRLQGEDGTWPLLARAADGAVLCPNRIVPGRYIFGMFDRAIEAARANGETAALADSFAACRDRALAYIERGPLSTWNWDGQFEDSRPRPPYQNLQKGVAIDVAMRLFPLGRTAEALECVDWCEDQFTVWDDPIHHMDWRHWKLPTALEQYDYYTPIDASMADMVRGFSAAYAATRDPLYRAKAKAMADCLVRHQRPDGTIPTYFDERGAGSDWVNCMVYSASALEFAFETLDLASGK